MEAPDWMDAADIADNDAHAAIEEEMTDLLESLVRMRRHRGLTREDVAEMMGIDVADVAAFEEPGADPHLSTVRRYALSVGASIAYDVVAPPSAVSA